MLFALLATGCGDHVVVEDYLALVALSPSHGAANISPDVEPRLTFNDAIDESTMAGSVWIEDSIGTVLPSILSYEAETWTVIVSPEEPLETSSSYTVRVTTGLTGVDYGPLSADLAASFATVGTVSGGSGNEAPIALITAPDEQCEVGTPLLLSGLESTDPEGASLSYSWRILNPLDKGGLEGETESEATLIAMDPANFVIGLVVDDGERSSSEAFLEVFCFAAEPAG